IIADQSRIEIFSLNAGRRIIDFLEKIELRAAIDKFLVDIDHVPLDISALDHSLKLGWIGGGLVDNPDAGFLGEGFKERLALRLLIGAALPDHDKRFLGSGRCACKACTERDNTGQNKSSAIE